MPEILVICGPTASGKSGVGALLAEQLRGEVVSADSMQVYRGLDIGTDKAPPELTNRVAHHMIDVVEPGEGYSAARYEREAGAIIDRLIKEDKLPIIVGGSGLYIRILINGIFPSPPASASIRKRLKLEAERDGIDTLYARLRGLDPAYADVAAPTDVRRIVRALEVFELTGSPFSAWHERHRAATRPRDACTIVLTRSRENLYERINGRVDDMFARGLVAEVRRLCDRGYTDALRRLRPLGYIEALDYLDGKIDLDEAVRLTKQNSRRYAKRQITWFKKEDAVRVELTPTDGAREAAEKILPLLPDVFRSRVANP
jgi:tRNA dimethylallyltransferase